MKFYRFNDSLIDIDSIETVVVTQHPQGKGYCVRIGTKSGNELVSRTPYQDIEYAFEALDKLDEEVELLYKIGE